MPRWERVIWQVIDEGRETCDRFRTRTKREKVVQYPVDRESTEHMPEDIESDMLRSIFMVIGAIEPESDQKKAQQDWLQIGEE